MAQKIADIAKNFNLKPKDVIDWVKQYGIEKKSGALLDDVELDIFLQSMTLANQLDNIEEYHAGVAKLISDTPRVKRVAPKPAPAPAPEVKPAPSSAVHCMGVLALSREVRSIIFQRILAGMPRPFAIA